MASPAGFADFEVGMMVFSSGIIHSPIIIQNFRSGVRYLTVDKLKALIQGLNDDCHTHISKTGKKQDLIDRIITAFDTFRTNNMEDRWLRAKQALGKARGE